MELIKHYVISVFYPYTVALRASLNISEACESIKKFESQNALILPCLNNGYGCVISEQASGRAEPESNYHFGAFGTTSKVITSANNKPYDTRVFSVAFRQVNYSLFMSYNLDKDLTHGTTGKIIYVSGDVNFNASKQNDGLVMRLSFSRGKSKHNFTRPYDDNAQKIAHDCVLSVATIWNTAPDNVTATMALFFPDTGAVVEQHENLKPAELYAVMEKLENGQLSNLIV